MRRNVLETAIGALVLAAAGGFLAFSYQAVDIGGVGSGYTVKARFDRVDGLKQGADVRMSGIKVGKIKGMLLETDTYLAVVEMEIDRTVQLPDDTSAEIVSESLLGGRFMSLTPGGSEKYLPEGGELRFTQSPVSLEQLIGKFIFSGGDNAAKP